jgi:hypothetical protein
MTTPTFRTNCRHGTRCWNETGKYTTKARKGAENLSQSKEALRHAVNKTMEELVMEITQGK